MAYKIMLDSFGQKINVYQSETVIKEPKQSKNAERKAKRYRTKVVKLTAHASFTKDSSGSKYEWSQHFHARRQCQSPEMQLIHAGY
jgi:hypothetical protein